MDETSLPPKADAPPLKVTIPPIITTSEGKEMPSADVPAGAEPEVGGC